MRSGWCGSYAPSWAPIKARCTGSPGNSATAPSRCGPGSGSDDIDDGRAPGVSTTEAGRIAELEQESRELKRANEILKRAASFFGADLDRQHKR